MREIDSAALRTVDETLGVGRPATLTRPTSFDDGTLQQTYDVGPQIRRGVTPGLAEGIWAMAFEHEHGAADATLTTQMPPYGVGVGGFTCAAGGAGSFASGWPNPVPRGMDVWILRASAFITSGAAADFNGALLDIILPSPSNAYACGVSLGNRSFGLVQWTDTYDDDIGSINLLEQGTKLSNPKVMQRVPRGAAIRLRTRNQNATGITILCNIMVGLMGAGLGQDALGG